MPEYNMHFESNMNKKKSGIITKAGSPAYIFSEKLFKERIDLVRSAFGDKVDLCFSVKANPFLVPFLRNGFARIEVCSYGEFEICRALSVSPEKILYSGVNKGLNDIEAVLSYNAGMLTAESIRHMKLISEAASSVGKTVPVLLRLSDDSQFGMDERDIIEIIRNKAEYPLISIKGLHYFTGTQKTKPDMILKELEHLEEFIRRIKEETGFVLEEAEYGTGLAVDYFSPEAQSKEEDRLKGISAGIRDFAEKIRLTVEMGRFFAAPCGCYITEIADLKKNGDVTYVICDGGLHQMKYDGQVRGLKIPVITHYKKADHGSGYEMSAEQTDDGELYTLCGSLCTTEDVVVRDVPLKDPAIGDRLVFHRTGGYAVTEGMTTFLSRDMPRIWLLREDGQLILARDRIETWKLNLPGGMSGS